MPTATNYRITKIGGFSGAQPQGRLWMIAPTEDPASEVVCSVDTSVGSARWDVAMQAFLQSRPVEAVAATGTGTLANPYVVDQIRITS